MEKVAEKKETAKETKAAANTPVDTKKTEEFRAKKAAAAKAFKERQAAAKKEDVDMAKKLLEDKSLKLPEDIKAWLNKKVNPVHASAGGQSFFNKVFGDSPKVGDKITLLDYMTRTLKAKCDMDKYCKQWAEKGTVVEFKQNADILKSEYVIVKM